MKITIGNRMSLIVKREEATEYTSIIKIQSSTSEQPFCGINFMDGKPVGGRTMTAMEVETMIAAAKKAGMQIED
jgi:hypothetical protein